MRSRPPQDPFGRALIPDTGVWERERLPILIGPLTAAIIPAPVSAFPVGSGSCFLMTRCISPG